MSRTAEVTRKTGETDIQIKLDLDGSGVCDIDTGVPFFRPHAQHVWSSWPV